MTCLERCLLYVGCASGDSRRETHQVAIEVKGLDTAVILVILALREIKKNFDIGTTSIMEEVKVESPFHQHTKWIARIKKKRE